MGGKGWWALGGSFAASALLTVSLSYGLSVGFLTPFAQFMSFLFPVIYSIPIFDVLSLPFGTSLAAGWFWWYVQLTQPPS